MRTKRRKREKKVRVTAKQRCQLKTEGENEKKANSVDEASLKLGTSDHTLKGHVN